MTQDASFHGEPPKPEGAASDVPELPPDELASLIEHCEDAARLFSGMGANGALSSYVDVGNRVIRIRLSVLTGDELKLVRPSLELAEMGGHVEGEC